MLNHLFLWQPLVRLRAMNSQGFTTHFKLCEKEKSFPKPPTLKEIKQNFIKPLGQKIFPLSAFMCLFYCSLIFVSHSFLCFFSRVFLIVQYVVILCGKAWSFLQRKIPFFRRFKSSGTWPGSSNHRKYGLEENIALPTTGKSSFTLNVSDSGGKRVNITYYQ